MRLTAPMRDALQAAAQPEGLRRVHKPGPGNPPWPAHPTTIAALIRHQLVEHRADRDRRGYQRDTWTITDLGRQALEPPARPRPERPIFLGQAGAGRDYVGINSGDDHDNSGDYTLNPSKSIDYEIREITTTNPDGTIDRRRIRVAIDVVDPDLLDHQPARLRHAGAKDRRDAGRRLARNARGAQAA